MDYHTVIAGAGIPGLYAARELAKAGKKVVVFESSKEPGEPNYSTAGIPLSTLKDFNLPKKGVNDEIKSFIFGTRNKEHKKSTNTPIGYVLDFKRMKQLLAKEVISLGGDVKWGVEVKDLIKDKNSKIIGVKTSKGIFKGKYIIDATGTSANLAEKARIRDEFPDKLTVGMEHIVKVKPNRFSKFKNTLCIYFDTELAPQGYAWVFCNGNNTYKIGIVEFWHDDDNSQSIVKRLDKFIDWLGRGDIDKIIETHGGSKFCTTNIKNVYKDNVLGIGDVVGGINPLFAEGIRHGLFTAKYAIEAILKDDLSIYQSKWDRYKGWRWNASEFFAKLLYLNQSQKALEGIISLYDRKLTVEDVVDIGFHYKFEKLLRYPIDTLKIVASKYWR